jgi:alpha-tubulin suppressor-like RCC1 family protein
MKSPVYHKMLAVLGFLLLCTVLNAQKTVTLSPSKDAYLYMTLKPGYEYYANTNYGSSNRFYSGEWSASNYRVNQRSVMDFDISSIPADAVIVEARLTLYAMLPQINDDYRHASFAVRQNSSFKSNASYLERITSPWTETGVTYNTQPATSTKNRLLLPESQAFDENYVDFDVTAMVQDMLNNPGESFGFMMRLQNESKYSRMAFCSREFADSSRRPKLVVTYNLKDKLSTFYYHSFILKTDGSLWAWGGNVSGELGDGTTTAQHTRVQIGSNEWKQVSAGYDHSLAIKNDGTLWGWGFNMAGQVGDGTSIERHSPVQIGAASNWTQVAAGYDHSVALKSDGTLWAWGGNEEGQLGNGTTTGRNKPVQIGTANNWKKIVAHKNMTLALKTDSTLWAWGSNDYGQLGDGTNTDKPEPVQIGTGKWIRIAAGWDHSMGIKANGTIWTWGYNNYSQLGDGTNTASYKPIQIDTNATWKDISAGFEHSMATKTDGTLWTWGYNYYGQLGNGTSGNSIVSPTLVEGVKDCIQIAAGWNYSVILKTDDQQCGSGTNGFGQLGDGTTSSKTLFNCVSPVVVLKSTATESNLKETAADQIDATRSHLSQNYPNPARDAATVDYYLSPDANNAEIIIYNVSNQASRQYILENKGNSSLEFDLQGLPSGIYIYIMYVNGSIADEKKLVISR